VRFEHPVDRLAASGPAPEPDFRAGTLELPPRALCHCAEAIRRFGNLFLLEPPKSDLHSKRLSEG